MVHLGDITKIKGCNAPVVDCIIGGSPCQDLSVAGKRAGLAGERSGLYMEQIRIIKEMRHKDEQRGRTGQSIRPRYMVWENVPGAFSSNQGKDFAAVLEEAIRIAEPEAPNVPVPEKGWPTAGCLMGDNWSVAWRVLDAQFWGVPQRRRRIALVADFGGQSAPEILFVRKGVRGYFETSRTPWQATPCHAEDCTGAADREAEGFDGYNGELTGRVAATLGVNCGVSTGRNGVIVCRGGLDAVKCYNIGDRRAVATESVNVSPTLTSKMGTRGNNVPVVFDARGKGDGKTANTLTGDHNNRVTDYSSVVVYSRQRSDELVENSVVSTKRCRQYKDATDLVMECAGIDCRNMNEYPELYPTLQAKPNGGQSLNFSGAVRIQYIVRRLTPLECERLQGFPDGWTDIGEWIDSKGKKHKEADSPRYKALGNSIAIPPWKWVLKRICACYERDATMASLFDGIGGFPYIWEQLNGKGSCLWASEIEEFSMAVTKLRFSE